MKKPSILPAVVSLFLLVGCQSGKHARVAVNPSPAVASSEMYYTFDQSFLTYFGPEGVSAMERTLQQAHPDVRIRVYVPEPEE
jgi:hypothetical protein